MKAKDKPRPIYTKTGKKEFIAGLLDSVRDNLIADVAKMPEDWDGHELRELIALRFDRERTDAYKVQSESASVGQKRARAAFRKAIATLLLCVSLFVVGGAAAGCDDAAAVCGDDGGRIAAEGGSVYDAQGADADTEEADEARRWCDLYQRYYAGYAHACGVELETADTAAVGEILRVTLGTCAGVATVDVDRVAACISAMEAITVDCTSGGDFYDRAKEACGNLTWGR